MISKGFPKVISFSEEMKKLWSNIISLGILQISNYILPLLTFPYLVRVLGAEYFGLLAFVGATTMYLSLITDYGFNLSATRAISINRDNQFKVNEIFSAVMIIKLGFLVMSLVMLSLLVFSFEKFNQHWELYFISFGIVVGQTIFPVWLFQGLEKMKYITYINLSAKAFFTACIFIFVHDIEDYWIVPTLNSLGFFVAGLFSLYIASTRLCISYKHPKVSALREQLYDGYHVFASTISISFYTISGAFILGLFAGNIVVGYYAVAEKTIQAVKGLYAPVSQAIYPSLSQKIHTDRGAGLVFAKNMILIIGCAMLLVSLALFFLAELIVQLLVGVSSGEIIILLKIMSFVPFLVSLSNIFGIQIMLNLGFQRVFSQILVVAAVLGLALNFALVPTHGAIGTAIATVGVELFVTIAMATYLILKLPHLFRSR